MKTFFLVLVSILCLSCIQGELNLDDVVYTSVSYKGIDISVWKDGDKFYMMPLGILKPNSLKVTNSTFAGFKPRFKYTLIMMTKNAKMLTLNHLRKLTGKCVKMEEIEIVPFTNIDVSVSVNVGFEMKHSWSFDFSQHPATISPSLICPNVMACDMWRAAFGQDPILKLDYRIGNETKATKDAMILNDNANSTDATLVKEVQCKTFSERKLEEISQLIKSAIPFLKTLKSIANDTSIIRKELNSCSGVKYIPYQLKSKLESKNLLACEDGWVLLMYHSHNSVDFDVGWNMYKTGFGNANENFWIGNENMHELTAANEKMVLRIDLIGQGSSAIEYIEVKDVKIGSESEKYKLDFGQTIYGTWGSKSDFQANRGMKFTTKDQDNDPWSWNCAAYEHYNGGWWFSSCGSFTLTSKFNEKNLLSMDHNLYTPGKVITWAQMKIRKA